jgi:hypothetical protein
MGQLPEYLFMQDAMSLPSGSSPPQPSACGYNQLFNWIGTGDSDLRVAGTPLREREVFR